MQAAVLRLSEWFAERATGIIEARQALEISRLRAENATLTEQLEASKVTNRIQQVELKQLMAVVARDLERVKAETRGNDVKAVSPE